MVRAPTVNIDQLQAMRTLLRLDFVRGLRNILASPSDLTGQSLEVLRLVDAMNRAEQPLVVIAALMMHHQTPTMTLVLDSDRFRIFSLLLARPLDSRDFPGLTEEELEAVFVPLRARVQELNTIFDSAPMVDEDLAKGKLKVGTAPSEGMLN